MTSRFKVLKITSGCTYAHGFLSVLDRSETETMDTLITLTRQGDLNCLDHSAL